MSQHQLDYLAPSFQLHLRAENKSPKTIAVYLAAMKNFTGWMSRETPDVDDWTEVSRTHLRQWSAWMIESTTPGNASVQWRGLQQFLRWATGEGEIEHTP